MRVEVTPGAARYVGDHGGRLYVWASGAACCGGTRFIEASTDAPSDADSFVPADTSGLEVLVRPAVGQLPDELRVDLRGRLRPRVEASWNGCAYLV
jgi:hypothetical protein